MSRKDNRGRVLRKWETQLKNGLYVLSYPLPDGTRERYYSYRLIDSDITPEGKKDKLPLRVFKKKIQHELANQIRPSEMNVIDLVESYISTKYGYVRNSTIMGYNTVLNILKKENFGLKPIASIKPPMAKEFLQDLQRRGRSYSSIHTIRGVLRPAFQRATENDWIIKNPFEFHLSEVIINDSMKREAISMEQLEKFLVFVKNDKHFCKYYDGIYILFFTGLRISEFCGLTISDIDFEEKTLNVCRQLQRQSDMTYVIEKPKTANGVRILPLDDDVLACFHRIIENRKKPAKEPVIDNVSGFLYLDKNGMPMVANHWEKYFQHILKKYKKTPNVELPKITPHVCRHTYCTNMIKVECNPSMVASLMGHSDKKVTLDVYTSINTKNSSNELRQMVDSAKKSDYFESLNSVLNQPSKG